MKRLARDEQWQVHCASSAEQGLEIIKRHAVDVVVSDMRMPGMDGAEFLSQVRRERPNTERILITGYSDIHALEKVVNEAKIFNYISKPWDDQVLTSVIQSAIEFQASQKERRRLEKLTSTQNRKLGRLALSLDCRVKEKDIEVQQALSLLQTEHERAQSRARQLLHAVSNLVELSGKGDGNAQFITDSAAKVASQLTLPERDLDNLLLASQLHNIGSLATADYWSYRVISDMDDNELKRYQAQIKLSEAVLSGLNSLAGVAEIIGKHKEHLDGSGYPRGLSAEAIPLGARIMCVVTEYVLLCEGRRTKGVAGHKAARRYIENLVGTNFDKGVVGAFFSIVDENTLRRDSTILTKDQQQLIPGMVLAANIYTPNDVLLLKSGTTLSSAHIDKLWVYENSTGDHLDIHVCRPFS